MVKSSTKLRLRSDCTKNYKPVLSLERAHHNKRTENVLREFPWKRNKDWLLVPDAGLIPGQAGRLTISHKMTLT
jgi:hypothetical protein